MWGDSFTYEADETKAYTMWWTEGGAAGVADAHDNPNDLITAAIIGTVDNKAGFDVANQTCEVVYYHKVGPPTPEGPDFTECHPWHANACCHEATVVTPKKMNEAYGVGYEWDRCGPMSQACERFFVEEACMYECEVNINIYRKYTDAQHAACSADGVTDGQAVTLSDGTAYTCTVGAWGGNDENKWQIHAMPIKASYADAWYRACANDLLPGGEGCDGSLFACAGTYHAQLAADAVLAAELAANETAATAAAEAQLAADLKAEKDKGLEAWAICLIIILALLGAPPPPPSLPNARPPARPTAPPGVLCLLHCPADSSPRAAGVTCCIGVVMLVSKEKQGKPMFMEMPADNSVQMASKA